MNISFDRTFSPSKQLKVTMPNNCSVFGCFNTKRKTKSLGLDIGFFRFPRNESLRDSWIQACRRKDKVNMDFAVICSVHFRQDDIADDMKSRLLGIPRPKNQRILKKNAVPSLFLPKG